MSTMSVARYRGLCRYAGSWIAEPVPYALPLDRVGDVNARNGVYIVCEPLERVQYVGSVWRPAQPRGVASRLSEHLREHYKRLAWKTVWIVPLTVETPESVVRSVEACVGAELGPLGSSRLPKL
jgi:hypothetical protein